MCMAAAAAGDLGAGDDSQMMLLGQSARGECMCVDEDMIESMTDMGRVTLACNVCRQRKSRV